MIRLILASSFFAGLTVLSASATPLIICAGSLEPSVIQSTKQAQELNRSTVPRFWFPSSNSSLSNPVLAPGLRNQDGQRPDLRPLDLRPFDLRPQASAPEFSSKVLLFLGLMLALFRWLQPAYRPRDFGR